MKLLFLHENARIKPFTLVELGRDFREKIGNGTLQYHICKRNGNKVRIRYKFVRLSGKKNMTKVPN